MVGPGATETFPNIQGRVSMFIAGFIMLTPHRIAMTCAPHILKRYHFPPDVVPLFIYKIHTPMELSNVLGQYIANIVAWIVRSKTAPRIIYRIFSIISVWLMFASGLISYKLFKAGDDYGYFNYFFWSIIFMTFTNGLYCASTFKLEGHFASMYGAGVPSSGFFTFFLHKFCKLKSKKDGWSDFDRSILMIQFWVTVITLGLSTIWWTIDIAVDINFTITKDGGKNSGRGFGTRKDQTTETPNKGILKLFTPDTKTATDNKDEVSHIYDWSPILMLAASLGTVYFFYPSISPYQLVNDDVMGKRIDLWILFTAAIPNFGVALLDIVEEIAGTDKYGPSGRSWTVSNTLYWQLSWIAIIPYLACIYIFLSFMHYPEGFFARHMKSKKWLVYIVCITFNFFQEWLESIGFAGAGAQIQPDGGQCEDGEENCTKPFAQGGQNSGKINLAGGAFNDDIAAFNVLLTITIVNISILIEIHIYYEIIFFIPVRSSGLPAADLREAEGEVNRRADGRTERLTSAEKNIIYC